jgi:hypothetical protein
MQFLNGSLELLRNGEFSCQVQENIKKLRVHYIDLFV